MKKIIHSTNAGGVILNTQGQVAIVNQHGTSWSLPKGHVEENEDVLSAAMREIYEETGLKELTLIRKLGTFTRSTLSRHPRTRQPERKTLHIYLFTTTEEALVPNDPANPSARWVEKEKVCSYLSHKDDRKFFEKVMTELF